MKRHDDKSSNWHVTHLKALAKSGDGANTDNNVLQSNVCGNLQLEWGITIEHRRKQIEALNAPVHVSKRMTCVHRSADAIGDKHQRDNAADATDWCTKTMPCKT